MRLLALNANLNLFRAFPDLETSELVVRNLVSRKILGLQIKTVGVDSAHPEAAVNFLASSFRPSPTTSVVVLGWLREQTRFHEECLLIPSEQVRSICEPSTATGHLSFEWHPGSRAQTHLDRFRIHTIALADVVAGAQKPA